ncbi:MAG: hypothetical protein O2999_15270 [Nitrospirae bacterium]|nr:hypothetical protein [Nitrospirota bacterium]MDA1305621.1 hypothetical protein [Nitrospirota bacterium]
MNKYSWREIFCPREVELNLLKEAWTKVSNPDKSESQVVALLAESGLGKTRIAQEFFNWLSTEVDGVEEAGYWPDLLGRKDDNLLVNPDLKGCRRENAMPFLWWGMRCQDPGKRNQLTTDVLTAYLPILEPHLEPLLKAKRALERRNRVGQAATELATTGAEAVPVIGQIFT